VKQQRSELEQFILINDNAKRFARDFISNGKKGKESKTAERQRKSVCERQRKRKYYN
jgi:hypothetical protein